MANILGLDLGTNSVGWALIDNNTVTPQHILGTGSRIIPMTQDVMGAFSGGKNIETETKVRTSFRGIRRLIERGKLRRERLLRVLHVMGFLPSHFANDINFDHSKPYLGKLQEGRESKIAWVTCEDGSYRFYYQEAFEAMLSEFKTSNPDMFAENSTLKIPYDWTLYYLRKKGLTQLLTNEELAWVLLSFNQKRGYYQLRGEDEDSENPSKLEEYHQLKVVAVTVDETYKGKDTWYNVELENGWVYRRSSKIPLFDWEGKQKEFIVTTDIDENGCVKKDKEGREKRSFRAPKEDDWTLLKKRTEQDIKRAGKTIGAYIYDNLLINPKQKIRGSLVRTVERQFYKEELDLILSKQIELNETLRDRELYAASILELYPSNTAYRNSIASRDFKYLLKDDILLYQRPLKSKKSLIDECMYECRSYIAADGEKVEKGVKCIAKSNPLFQEFRLWQFIKGLKILRVDDTRDVDVTAQFLPDEAAVVKLYKWLNDRDAIKQSVLLTKYFKIKKSEPYRWNYVEDREYPCNTTRALFLSCFGKCEVDAQLLSQRAVTRRGAFLDYSVEQDLWHLLYSITDKYELITALGSFASKYNLNEKFVEVFKKTKPFESAYGAYSEKAIKRLLPLMRVGEYWHADAIDATTKLRIEKVIDGEYDETIKTKVYQSTIDLSSLADFKNLPLWLACYIVYDRHSEAKDTAKWSKPEQLQQYIAEFKQHSLHNPIVEQVVLESLRVVKDIWVKYGSIDRIHIELGRELKQDKKSRERATQNNVEQENTNLRIKAMLMEFQNDPEIAEVRPQSPSQQLILKIYEEGALNSIEGVVDEDILKISKLASPSQSEIRRYKLWLEQKYRSPYTGEIIPLARLFTSDYEIEHVIPQKMYFDDSFTNKVICEAAVNSLKGARLAMNFIEEEHGRSVTVASGKSVRIFSSEEYVAFVKANYKTARNKQSRLLMTEIPDGFISRQLNDTRYISKLMMHLMSNIVREEREGDIALSTNVLSCSGAITTKLKQEWGLNDVWNKLVTPRFERLNEMNNTTEYGHWCNKDGKNIFLTSLPFDKQKGFNKKRIDHRHHALDALVIANVTRSHVNYFNNESAKDSTTSTRYDLKNKLCEKTKIDSSGSYQWRFKKPWDTYTQDVDKAIQAIVVSFKQNTRVLTRTNNRTEAIGENGKKIFKTQEGENLAIRKSLHKDTVYGRVNLQLKKMVSLKVGIENYEFLTDRSLRKHVSTELRKGVLPAQLLKTFKQQDYNWYGKDVSKVEIYYFTDNSDKPLVATRKALNQDFDLKKIADITDKGIQKILTAWLLRNNNNPELAFSPEGVEDMNRHIKELNGGKPHQPIFKVRLSSARGKQFCVGERGNRKSKFVKADEGTNLYLGVYADSKDLSKRRYESIPLNVVIERLKQQQPVVPVKNEQGDKLLFSLSPNDLVYLPTADQLGRPLTLADIDNDRIYKMVSASSEAVDFIKSTVATSIVDKKEFTSHNKMQRAITGEMIKETCLKLNVDRLGCITQIGGRNV